MCIPCFAPAVTHHPLFSAARRDCCLFYLAPFPWFSGDILPLTPTEASLLRSRHPYSIDIAPYIRSFHQFCLPSLLSASSSAVFGFASFYALSSLLYHSLIYSSYPSVSLIPCPSCYTVAYIVLSISCLSLSSICSGLLFVHKTLSFWF